MIAYAPAHSSALNESALGKPPVCWPVGTGELGRVVLPSTSLRWAAAWGGSPSDTVRWLEGASDVLARLYSFRDHKTVSTFLRDHSFLEPLLFAAYGRIRQCFGQHSPIALTVFSDPEAVGNSQLFILIQRQRSPAEALGRLSALDRQWWLQVLPLAHGKLSIDVEYE